MLRQNIAGHLPTSPWLAVVVVLFIAGVLHAAPGFPPGTARALHQGWEYRSDHFVVLAITSLADARTAAEQMEAAFSDMARLADRFTSAHRRAGFAEQAIPVVLESRPARVPNSRGVERFGDAVSEVLYFQLSSTQGLQPRQIRDLRTSVARPFLREIAAEQALPDWVIDGLGDYLAESDRAEQDPKKSGPGNEGVQPASVERPSRSDPKRRWVPYLLTAKEGAYVPQLTLAIRKTIEDDRRSRNNPASAHRDRTRDSTPGIETPLDRLVREVQNTKGNAE